MIDTFKRNINYMRVSVTELCNLRCRYCMPEDGVCKKTHDEMLSEDELVTAVSAAASIGIRKIRITGGEPLVKRNIVSICKRISSIDGIDEVCLTTNGINLDTLAEPLKEAGVNRINISLDTLDPDKYAYITRIGKLEDALKGIKAALETGFEKIKLNAVLIGGFNDDEIPSLAGLTKFWPVDMRFIEMMPMYDSGDFGPESYIPYTIVTDLLPELVEQKKDGSVAKLYKLPGGQGNIGLISPVSDHFCAECNRIRLTADGKVKPCLHSSAEYSLKGKDFEGMIDTLKAAIISKPEWHGELNFNNRSKSGRNMNMIGG